jgi:hypothetical protein
VVRKKGKAMSKISRGFVAVGVLAILTFGLSPAQAELLPHETLCSPNNSYITTSDNTYFPMRPGQLSIFLDDQDPDEPEGLRIKVLDEFETIYGNTGHPIVTRVVEEVEWFDTDRDGKPNHGEELIEISRNYYADSDGTVCYFGEAVDIFHEDGSVTHEGAWRADVPSDPPTDNAPGIIMPADPQKGDVYLQEFAPTVAMDQAKVLRFGTFKVGSKRYPGAMRTAECSLVEHPDCRKQDLSDKVYAPGKGLVQDGGLVLTSFKAGK